MQAPDPGAPRAALGGTLSTSFLLEFSPMPRLSLLLESADSALVPRICF